MQSGKFGHIIPLIYLYTRQTSCLTLMVLFYTVRTKFFYGYKIPEQDSLPLQVTVSEAFELSTGHSSRDGGSGNGVRRGTGTPDGTSRGLKEGETARQRAAGRVSGLGSTQGWVPQAGQAGQPHPLLPWSPGGAARPAAATPPRLSSLHHPQHRG